MSKLSKAEERFLENMKSYGLGSVIQQLADSQDEVVRSVHDTGLMGQVTMTLKFKRAGNEGMVVEPNIDKKIPRKPIQAVEMYVDKKGHLHESNPEQMSFGENVTSIEDGKKKVESV